MLGFITFPVKGSVQDKKNARNAILFRRRVFVVMVIYFEVFWIVRRLPLSFLVLGAVSNGGVVDSPQSVINFLSFALSVTILFLFSGRLERSLISYGSFTILYSSKALGWRIWSTLRATLSLFLAFSIHSIQGLAKNLLLDVKLLKICSFSGCPVQINL